LSEHGERSLVQFVARIGSLIKKNKKEEERETERGGRGGENPIKEIVITVPERVTAQMWRNKFLPGHNGTPRVSLELTDTIDDQFAFVERLADLSFSACRPSVTTYTDGTSAL